MVKSLMVSSREGQAGRLIDGTESYWQSAGSQGKVRSSKVQHLSTVGGFVIIVQYSDLPYPIHSVKSLA